MQKQKNISTLIGIIIIVLVAVILFGGVFAYQYYTTKSQQNSNFFASRPKTYQIQNQNVSTADWKTYANTQYGFDFQYPVTGRIENKTEDGYALAWVPSFWPPQVKVVSINEDVIQACPISNGGYYDQLASSKKFVNIEGFGNPITLYKLSYNGTKSGSLRYCYVVKSTKTENYIMYFEFTSNVDVDHVLEKDFDALTQKVVSTFKFTTPADQTAGLKTYDSGDGFEFKYPTTKSFVTLNEPEIIRGNANINNDGCFIGNDNGRYPNPVTEREKVSIYDNKFCISETGDSAMGHSYPTYFYTTTYKNGDHFTIVFPFDVTNCDNLKGGSNYKPCQDFFSNTLNNPYGTTMHIMDTFRFFTK